MKFVHRILDTSHFCNTANAHRLIPASIKRATKSERVSRETLLTFFRAIERRNCVQQRRRGLATQKEVQHHRDQHDWSLHGHLPFVRSNDMRYSWVVERLPYLAPWGPRGSLPLLGYSVRHRK